MLNHTYLNLSIAPFTAEESETELATSITILSSDAQLETFAFSPSIRERIDENFKSGESAVYLIAESHPKLIAVYNGNDKENWRLLGASIYQKLKGEKISKGILEDLATLDKDSIYSLLEGSLLASYSFDKYKTVKKSKQIKLLVDAVAFDSEKLNELLKLADAISLCKTLVNEPLNFLNSIKFSEIATEAGQKFGFETEILHIDTIKDLKMGGLLGVNRGSDNPPTFNVFEYKPEHAINEKPLIIIGKGVMYDTGGYSLKVGGSMTTMKCDMAGGAAVMATISAVAANKLPYHIVGLVPATDNMISPKALVVDDIITMMDGTTVEVLNTDAEGRLVLADALTYAKKYDPALVIDIATLTGASAAITGPYGIAMAGNDAMEMKSLTDSGENVYERIIQLPFWKEFADLLKSDIADLKNIGGPVGGASTAGKFLEHFTAYPWIHLDIAGAAFVKEAKGYKQSGGTAVAVRLLYDFIKKKCEA